MEAMNKLASEQDQLAKHLQKLLTDAKAAKTRAQITSINNQLGECWSKAQSNHEKINELGIATHSYHSKNYFQQMEAKLNEVRGQLLADPVESALLPKLRIRRERIATIRDEIEFLKALMADNTSKINAEKGIERLENLREEFKMQQEALMLEHMFSEDDLTEGRDLQKEISKVIMDLGNLATPASREPIQRQTWMLPPMKLPSFEGGIAKWSEFRDLFQSSINRHTTLTDAERMQQLKLHIRGEPAQLLQHLMISDVNYQTAWQILDDRYNNRRLLLAQLIDKILDQSKCKGESARELKTLHDTTKECLQAIANMGYETKNWSPFIGRIVTRLWDNETSKLFDQSMKNPHEVQDLEDILKFLENRFQALEGMKLPLTNNTNNHYTYHSNNNFNTSKNLSNNNYNETALVCELCNGKHTIIKCYKFNALKPQERITQVQSKQLCLICLRKHKGRCQSNMKCNECHKSHHTMIHVDNYKHSHPQRERRVHTTMSRTEEKEPLLATALVHIPTIHGELFTARVLIDPASHSSLITENAVQQIGLPKHHTRAEVSGLGDKEPQIAKSYVRVQICSRFNNTFKINPELLVLSKLTSALPTNSLEYEIFTKWSHHPLADPYFYRTSEIDIILGVVDYCQLLLDGVEKQDGYMAQNSELGWLISGGWTNPQETIKRSIKTYVQTCVKEDISRFWEIEELLNPPSRTPEDEICENIFTTTTRRGDDGRYTVSLPLKETPPNLGDSKFRAMAQLIQLEKRLGKDKKLRADYKDFMKEYLQLGHMKEVNEAEEGGGYYIPHHAVVKMESTTTKLRVVFNASCPTTTNKSLNDEMFVGPQLQNDITKILLRWRTHKIVFVADIEKMYRQIKIVDEQQQYQKILWRFHPNAQIKEYCLKTVTYGTAAAPYLAIRTLHQLAADEEADFPEVAEIIRNDFYVDDVLSGAETLEMAAQTQLNLLTVMKKGGFNLRKWSSNNLKLLETLPEELIDQSILEVGAEETKKTLGIIWNPIKDEFSFKINIKSLDKITKRTILSEVSKIYDPLGWLSPVIINAKLQIQQLWIEKYDWDNRLPAEHIIKWNSFYNELPSIENVKIKRWMASTQGIELHGFCDASEKAYGAVVYSRSLTNEKIVITLLQAKSKVAPLKTRVTIPRLELCAAQLLAKLLNQIRVALNIDIKLVHAWSDSMIALAWIKNSTNKTDTFVDNRVAEINRHIPHHRWQHVRTNENPADLITRGVNPTKISDNNLWWVGPTWLCNDKSTWPAQPGIQILAPAVKVCAININNINIIDRFSSLSRMLRVLTYCRLFGNPGQKIPLQYNEIEKTLIQIIKQIQSSEFKLEIKAITTGEVVNKSSPIKSLNPIMDHQGLLSVGGRLENAALSYRQKHQILLPSKHHLSRLIIQDAHYATLHGGIEMTLAYLRRKYWIPNAKDSIRSMVRNCTTCIRYKAETTEQLMGQLPKPRVTPSKPFTHTGVDYAGPINVRTTKGRGNRSTKGYIAIFICLATKAIHIEVVSDLTTNTFLAAFKRFISRRGPCHHMYSDNGTTFVGAAKQLKQEIKNIEEAAELQTQMVTMGTQWHFIPAVSPHFGGLWEAGVKSIKQHLQRQIGDSTLTFEELTTLLSQIEACLNSRPLYSSSNDQDDPEIITAGHFLIGSALIEPPNPVTTDITGSLAERWQVMQRMKRGFWKSWSTEYLTRLQHQYKWHKGTNNLTPGTVVIIKEKNINPARWPLAKIVEVHPGNDEKVRVVTLKGNQGKLFKRAIVNLIPLPTGDKCDSSISRMPSQSNVTQIKHTKRINHQSRPKTSLLRILSMLWLFLTTATAQFSIEKVNSGVYVEHLGEVYINAGSFRMKVAFEKEKIRNDIKTAEDIDNHFADMCLTKAYNKSADCKILQHHLERQTKKLDWIKKDLAHMQGPSRQRRGVLGTILTSMFGVNDEVYRDIDTLDKNQRELIRTSHQQGHLMMSTLISMNDTQSKIDQELLNFHTQLSKLKKQINAAPEGTLRYIQLQSAFQQGNAYISEVCDHYSKLTKLGINQGEFLEIVSPAQVAAAIRTSEDILPMDKRIVTTHLTETTMEQNSTHIIAYGSFPIIDMNEYVLLKLTGTPINIKDTEYTTLDMSNDLIGVNYNKQLTFELTREDFHECILLNRHKFICAPTVITKLSTSENCIIEAIFNNKEPCAQRTIAHRLDHITWKQLMVPNAWVFVTKQPISVGIECHHNRTNALLQGSGILRISPQCRIDSKQHILMPKQMRNMEVIGSYAHPVPIRQLTTKENVDLKVEEKVYKHTEKLQELIATEAMALDEQENTVWKHVEKHQSYIWVAVVIIFVAGLILLAIKFCIKSRKLHKDKHAVPEAATAYEMEDIPPGPPACLSDHLQTGNCHVRQA